MALNLQHQTAAQFVARLREKYRNSTKEECARIAHWIYTKYQAGDVTAAQIKAAFGFDDAQFTVFANKVQTLSAHWVAVQEAQGE